MSKAELRGGKQLDGEFTEREIENIARRLQNTLWTEREDIWEEPKSPVDILDPSVGLEAIGYVCEQVSSLGQFTVGDDQFEVAAVIDDTTQHVEVSGENRRDTLRFTTAHELGHALMHESDGLHRDRPLGEVSSNPNRDRREWEADKFASYFLMPEKQVRPEFARRFDSDQLYLDDNTAFGLRPGSERELSPQSTERRDFARVVAETQQFGGSHFHSLSERFGVSTEAMAIRLEELDLVRV
jgi:Zn-dependent peptidase ImmA (M78 family)